MLRDGTIILVLLTLYCWSWHDCHLSYISCRSECELSNTNTNTTGVEKKKSAYSLAPNRVSCPYCPRTFPWTSSLRRHVLTHTGQKPYKCPHCSLLFTTKSNCDRHLLRKHGNQSTSSASQGGGSSSSSETSPGSSSGNYTMRNVPERPYKCNYCPSSTFSTQSNLKKHVQTKHSPVSPGPAPQSLIPRCVTEGKILTRTVRSCIYESTEVLTVVLLNLQVFQDVVLFHFMSGFWRCKGLWYLYLQDQAVQEEEQYTTSNVWYRVSDNHREWQTKSGGSGRSLGKTKWRWMKEYKCKPSLTLALLSYKYPKVPLATFHVFFQPHCQHYWLFNLFSHLLLTLTIPM